MRQTFRMNVFCLIKHLNCAVDTFCNYVKSIAIIGNTFIQLDFYCETFPGVLWAMAVGWNWMERKQSRSKWIKDPFIFFHFSNLGLQGDWSLSQLPWCERQGTLCTGSQEQQTTTHAQLKITPSTVLGFSLQRETNSTQKGGFEPRTFFLWGGSAHHHTTHSHHPRPIRMRFPSCKYA